MGAWIRRELVGAAGVAAALASQAALRRFLA